MEYADKGDLYQKIVEFKKAATYFEEIDIWRIFIQLVRGLKALHDLKILHRDLKSANVFLFTDGSAKLGDLNVSKVARRGLGYTQTGTPYYARYNILLMNSVQKYGKINHMILSQIYGLLDVFYMKW
jgi:NIMA (never in mitosis gene a)-related kinase